MDSKHRRLVPVVQVVTLGVVVALVVALSPVHAGRHRTSAPAPPPPATHLGRFGVVSSAIVAENERRGTTAWRLGGEHARGSIDGFANENYARVGQSVTLYVSTDAPRFHVVAFRMGYYHGRGARRIWTSATVRGRRQPVCLLTPVVNMVSCDNWRPSLTFTVTAAFVQGDYLLKLIGSGNQQAYVLLTVWDPHSHATYLVVARSLTEEGWNTYGGFDYYQGLGPCPPDAGTYPACNRARVVSFDRPYADGHGASDFLGNEFPFVFWAEEHGLDVAYVTDVTLTQHPSVMLHHRVIVSLGHDETWTNQERVGALAAVARGENIVFFGAAAVLRHSRLQSSPLGPGREEVDYRDAAADPLNGVGNPMAVTGNTWSSPPTNWSEDALTGEGYAGFIATTTTFPFVVADASSWLYAGTGLRNGSRIPHVITSDIDHVVADATVPRDLQVLGHSPIPIGAIYTNQGDWNGYTYSDATYWTDPRSKAGVFDTGTVNWIAAMATCPRRSICPARDLRLMTGNLLRLFGQGPAGRRQPSRDNLGRIRPRGS